MKKRDLIIIFVILAAAGMVYLIVGGADTQSGAVAVVSVSGEERDLLDLSVDGQYQYTNAGGSNTVIVSDGTVRVSKSDCHDKYCVKQGSISKQGESIVCLPHRLVIEIRSSAGDGVDAVAR